MKRTAPYHLLVRLTAVLLLTGFTMPSGLHAKQFVECCLMSAAESSTAPEATTMPVSTPPEVSAGPEEESSGTMPADHSCCKKDQQLPDGENMAHSCGETFICTCHVDQAPLSDQNGTVINKSAAYITATSVISEPEYHDGTANFVSVSPPDWITPPIFLLNSTFLN